MKGSQWRRLRMFAGTLLVVTLLAGSIGAHECMAASKEECLEAHGRGQDLRDAARLTSARQTFLACAQSSCPALIQADCARFSEELDRLVPTVSFAARDPNGGDLPDTTVFVDDQQVTMRLDEGKSFDLDPGKHAVRFVHGGRETVVTIVLNQGEKGRSVVATFADPALAEHALPSLPPVAAPKRSAAPLVVAGIGAVAAIAGAVLVTVGVKEVPSSCSIGSRQCVAPPGDPAFGEAHRGVGLANLGLGIGAGGAALLAGGVVWYLVEPPHPRVQQERAARLVPWLGDRSGGLSVSSRF
jgi:hypothetical protein